MRERGLPDVEIRTWVRTGDTPSGERERMRRRPPHILVTTPESLYILLGSASGRAMLASTRTVIVDEIHAMASNKRGAHLALSLERLSALCGDRLGAHRAFGDAEPDRDRRASAGWHHGATDVTIVDTGHQRPRELMLEVPNSPLGIRDVGRGLAAGLRRLARLTEAHRTTLVFVNTRRMAERVARQLSDRLGEQAVTAHHGSMAKEQRLSAEQRLKRGELKALVATASLELGIDIGDVDLVCQLGLAAFDREFPATRRTVRATRWAAPPKGHLFPLSRDDLVECAALLDSVRRGELDRLSIPQQPLDVLAQQIVAEVSAQDWPEGELYDRLRRAWPYRALRAMISMQSFACWPRASPPAAAGAARWSTTTRSTTCCAAGAARDCRTDLGRDDPGQRRLPGAAGTREPDHRHRQRGLRRRKPRRRRVSTRQHRLPHHAGRARRRPGGGRARPAAHHPVLARRSAWPQRRTFRFGVPSARRHSQPRCGAIRPASSAKRWLTDELGIAEAARGTVARVSDGVVRRTGMPADAATRIVLERFFDEAGGMQLVIHSPFGSRINRAWGLALRKRFCRKFNFELQAAATEDNIVLSLTTTHSFDLAEVAATCMPPMSGRC